MNLEKIIAITGKPGLFKLISQSNKGVIVESLVDKKRFPANAMNNISSLGDIAIYTYGEEVALKDVFLNIHQKETGKTAISHKSDKQVLTDYFREVLPEYDEERVYTSNLKKILQWYNILITSGFDFTTEEEVETNKENSAE